MIFPRTTALGFVAAFPLHAHAQNYFDLWTYDPTQPNGPPFWGTLDIEGNECFGSAQSGLSIPASTVCDSTGGVVYQEGDCTLDDLTFYIDPHAANYDLIESATCAPPSMRIEGDNRTYTYFHSRIHSSSEHAIGGSLFEAELHMAFTSDEENHLGVIAVMISSNADSPNLEFQEYLDRWLISPSNACASPGRNRGRSLEVDALHPNSRNRRLDHHAFMPLSMIPLTTAYYHYEGSLTIPPCSEILTVIVAEEQMQISRDQMVQLRTMITTWEDPSNSCLLGTNAFMGSTARPVQQINGRTINRICSLPTGPFPPGQNPALPPPATPPPVPFLPEVTMQPVAPDVPVVVVPVPVPVPAPGPLPVPQPEVPSVPVSESEPATPALPSPSVPTLPPISILITPPSNLEVAPVSSGAKETQVMLVTVLGLLTVFLLHV